MGRNGAKFWQTIWRAKKKNSLKAKRKTSTTLMTKKVLMTTESQKPKKRRRTKESCEASYTQYETDLEANPKSSTVCQCKWPDNGERAAISIALNVFVSSRHSLQEYLQRWQFDVIGIH